MVLYLNPADKALVLCVDKKSQIQALERTQPILPMGLGYVEGVTHDYERRGTTTLFAALDVQNGKVITQCKSRHRHQEFLSFLRHLDDNVPTSRHRTTSGLCALPRVTSRPLGKHSARRHACARGPERNKTSEAVASYEN